MSRKYMPLYVDEFQFRYKNREKADILERRLRDANGTLNSPSPNATCGIELEFLGGSRRHAPPNETTKTELDAKPDQRGSEKQPLINVVPTAEQKADAEKKDAEAKLKAADGRARVVTTDPWRGEEKCWDIDTLTIVSIASTAGCSGCRAFRSTNPV
jgi:hypothetical protein